MEWYKIKACYLDESELNYELLLRDYSTRGSLEERRRDLRAVLRDPESERLVRVTEHMMIDDLCTVPRKLKEIADILYQGSDPSCLSRLVHYHQRIRRYQPRTRRQQEDVQYLLDLISRITMHYYGLNYDDALRSAPVAESTVQVQLPEGNGSGAPLNMAVGSQPVPHSFSEQQMNSQHYQESPILRTWNDTEGAVGGNADTAENATDVIPALVENLLNFRNQEQGPATGAIPRQMRLPSLPTAPLLQEEDQAVGNSQNIRDFERRVASEHIEFRRTESQRGSPATFEPPRVGVSPSVPNPFGTILASRTVPVNEKMKNSDYVHVSEITTYVDKCFDQLLRQRFPGLAGDPTVDLLSNNLSGMNLQSRGPLPRAMSIPSDHPTRVGRFPDPSPPLQLSGNAMGHRSTPVPDPGAWNPVNPTSQPRNDFRSSAHSGIGNVTFAPMNQMNSGRLSTSGYPRRLPHQQCSIIEKWPKFTGDTNTVPVTDFLRQIDILCRSYDITKQELRMHAHLLFKDSAYVWYTTYEEKFTSWEMLESYLKMRYDNPNRDRIIREEMRARKQRPTELFSAYLTEMEMLAQRMMKKMTEAEKFEVIVENMKQSYKRRLALEPIHSIEHLAQLCFKFDALESNLYTISGHSRPVIHQLDCHEDSDDGQHEIEEAEELNAIKARFNKKIPMIKPTMGENQDKIKQLICWNCQGVGHMWRECDRRKTIFCHICGLSDTTAYRCPNKHELGQRDELPKND